MTDYKQLCAELVAAWDDLPWQYDWKGNLTGIDGYPPDDSAVERARAALAEPEPEGPTQPISVSERLPGPEDCDAEGLCWAWHTTAYTWGLFRLDLTAHSHWLPANALPLPSWSVNLQGRLTRSSDVFNIPEFPDSSTKPSSQTHLLP